MPKPAEIRLLAKSALESKANLNNVAVLLELCQPTSSMDTLQTVMQALQHVFSKLLETGRVFTTNKQLEKSKSRTDKVAAWLTVNYQRFISFVISMLTHKDVAIQISAFDVLLDAVRSESSFLTKRNGTFKFPIQLYSRVTDVLLDSERVEEELLDHLVDTLNRYADLRAYYFKNVGGFLNGPSENSAKAKLLKGKSAQAIQRQRFNAVECMKRIQFQASNDVDLVEFLCPDVRIGKSAAASADILDELDLSADEDVPAQSSDRRPLVAQLQFHRKAFSNCWMAIFKLPNMPLPMYKQILAIVHKRIIPYMTNPTLLMDFLTDSYRLGGVISLLALNGLFTLINKHNLDYPNFYHDLYALLKTDILYVKYRSRFFRMLDLFLSSTHIPAYLVAAFIKRLSRLALYGPPAAAIAIIPMIYNLLRRHPMCIALIHADASSGAQHIDPYDEFTQNPANCKAIESSLWEIQVLKNHYLPAVAELASIFEEPLTKPEFDLEDFLDQTYVSLIEEELGAEEGTKAPLHFKLEEKRWASLSAFGLGFSGVRHGEANKRRVHVSEEEDMETDEESTDEEGDSDEDEDQDEDGGDSDRSMETDS
ncbi:CBF/Mak21 family-domain-containing protein [Cladochytrium replicatum]|nr:CBF/Mak21 family-domain-containing protein [Cladochytrium replicatum]